jgi:hypothetical protein
MNKLKDYNREQARKTLTNAGLDWQSFNDDNHWKVNGIDFWPTTHKWLCPDTQEVQLGIKEFIDYIRPKESKLNKLSVDQLFNIASHSKEKSLIGICRALHKEIYK